MRFDNPFCEGCSFQSTCRIYFQLQKEFLIYLSSVPNDSRPHFCNSWDKILIFSLELEFYQKQLVPSLIPTIRSSYARQMKKLSKFRNLFCIVPMSDRGLILEYSATKVSHLFDNKKCKSLRPQIFDHFEHEFDFLGRNSSWSKMT